MIKNKKASLELGIRAIVIIVLAMTILGLGLGFVRVIFKNMEDTTITVTDQVKQQIMDDLRRGDKKLSFPRERITTESDTKEDIAIGVKNTGADELEFEIRIEEQVSGSFVNLDPTTNSPGSFFWDNSDQTLSVGESRVYGILHQSEVAKNTYLYKIIIYDTERGEDYDTKSFFVTVV